MSSKIPVISWFEGTNEEASKVVATVSYGVVDADSDSPDKKFFIWNNRSGTEDVAKMEDVQFTSRDRNGGLGDTTGSIVEAVKDNWYHVRVDSLSETGFKAVGKGGIGTSNPSGTKQLGTTGQTTNIKSIGATSWIASNAYSLGDVVKPTADNGFVYEVTVAGITGATEPTWLVTQGLLVEDGTVQFTAIQAKVTPKLGEILGLANNTLPDGSNADLAAGNFAEITVYAEVPLAAQSGINSSSLRASYKFV